METYLAFFADKGIDSPAFAGQMYEEEGELLLRLFFGPGPEGASRELVIVFGRALAFSSHDEFAHPAVFREKGALPRLADGKHAFPCLIVENSDWLTSFSDSQISQPEEIFHLRFYTLDRTYDVLTGRMPSASWFERKPEIDPEANWRSQEDMEYYHVLGPEDGPGSCAILGCDHLVIAHSTRCRLHHFEMIKGYIPMPSPEGFNKRK